MSEKLEIALMNLCDAVEDQIAVKPNAFLRGLRWMLEAWLRASSRPAPRGDDLIQNYRRLCPSGVLREHGVVVGAWHARTIHDRLDVWWVRRVENRIVEGMEDWPCPLTPDIDAHIAKIAQSAPEIDESRKSTPRCESASYLMFDTPVIAAGLANTIKAELEALGLSAGRGIIWSTKREFAAAFESVVAPLRKFRETLDPEAFAFAALLRHDPFLSQIGFDAPKKTAIFLPGIDRTLEPGAPLKTALEAYPEHSAALFDAWNRDREPFRRLSAREITIESLIGDGLLSEGVNTMPRSLATKIVDAGADVRAAFLRTRSPAFERHAELAHVYSAGSDPFEEVLPHLPQDWFPKGADEWAAFLIVAAGATALTPPRPWSDLPAFFDAKGRWRECLSRIEASAGPLVNRSNFELVLRDRRDPVARFNAQVVVPSGWLVEGRRPFELSHANNYEHPAALALIYGDKTLAGLVAASMQWHARQGAMDADLSAFAPLPEEISGWAPGLPRHETKGIVLQPLTSTNELVAEGRLGANDDGTFGLDHCVGGYSGVCRRGASRIVSLRRFASDGSIIRLSTAEIDVSEDSYPVLQHLAESNSPPSPDCQAALESYLAAIQSGKLPVDRSAFTTPDDSDMHEAILHDLEAAGYDFRTPGAFERAMATWSPFLPRYARDWTPEKMLDYAKSMSPPALG